MSDVARDPFEPAPVSRCEPEKADEPETIEGASGILSRAMAAMREGRWREASDGAKNLLARDADDLPAALLVAAASRELDELADAESALAPFVGQLRESAELAFSYALNAEKAKDFERAMARWQIARMAFPAHPYPWAAQATMLSILDRLDEADGVLGEALDRGHNGIEILAARVQVAIAKGDWLETHRRWTDLEKSYPHDPYVGLAGKRTRDTIVASLAHLDLAHITEQASRAEKAADWGAASFYWGLACDRLPDRADFDIAVGRALREAGRFDDADAHFRQGLDRHSRNMEYHANFAEVAAVRKDWPEAARRWSQVLGEFPDAKPLWPMAASAFREVGELQAAASLLEKAASDDPDNISVRVQQALTAEKAGDWPSAISCWNEAVRLRPDDLVIKDARGNAIWEQQIARLEAGSPASETVRVDAGQGADTGDWRALALSFEGLGDKCEFGIVQRRLGADPIGLFRFAAISVDNLVALLDEDLDRLGDPEFTELGLCEGGEYLVRDRRDLYHMHCFVQQGTVEARLFLSQQIRRIGYLKRKLIEDLQAGEKIFVFKSSLERISDASLRRLQAAIGRYGDGILLGLRRAEEGHKPGSLEIVQQRVLAGYLDTQYSGEETPIDLESWRKVLLAAARYRHDARPQTQAGAELVRA